MKSFQQFKKEAFKNPEVLKAYRELEPEFKLIQAIIAKRLQRRLSQAALAKKIGTRQSAIARLESGSYNPTIGLLKKVAKALDARLVVSIS